APGDGAAAQPAVGGGAGAAHHAPAAAARGVAAQPRPGHPRPRPVRDRAGVPPGEGRRAGAGAGRRPATVRCGPFGGERTGAAPDVPVRTSAMELDLDALPAAAVTVAPAVSAYPPALIDVALVVDAATPAARVEAALVDGAGDLLEAVRLFDVYAGEQVGPD